MTLRLIALLALLLMPFGMSAPAAAHGAATAHATQGPCESSAPAERPDKQAPQVHCTATCTALSTALPQLPTVLLGTDMPGVWLPTTLDGRLPELATPPPKLS